MDDQQAIESHEFEIQSPEEKEELSWRKICTKYWLCIFYPSVLVVIILIAVIASLAQASQTQDEKEPKDNMLGNGRQIVRKYDWDGDFTTRYIEKLSHPVPFVVISETGTEACGSPDMCAYRVKILQILHMKHETPADMNLPDIIYNFVVGGDGNVYEGRGWDDSSSHTGFVEGCNIGISFIGKFVTDFPTNSAIESARELIKLGVELGKIDYKYKLVSINQIDNKASPGIKLHDIIKDWPNLFNSSEVKSRKC